VLREAVLESRTAQAPKPTFRRFYIATAVAAAVLVVLVIFLWPFWKPAPQQTQPTVNVSKLSFKLEPELTRSTTGREIAVPVGAREVNFDLVLAHISPSEEYRVILGTVERPAAWRGAAVVHDKGLATVVPAEVLSPGDYTLELQAGKEDIATFYFRVAKRE
jgi:hypothetical protein